MRRHQIKYYEHGLQNGSQNGAVEMNMHCGDGTIPSDWLVGFQQRIDVISTMNGRG